MKKTEIKIEPEILTALEIEDIYIYSITIEKTKKKELALLFN